MVTEFIATVKAIKATFKSIGQVLADSVPYQIRLRTGWKLLILRIKAEALIALHIANTFFTGKLPAVILAAVISIKAAFRNVGDVITKKVSDVMRLGTIRIQFSHIFPRIISGFAFNWKVAHEIRIEPMASQKATIHGIKSAFFNIGFHVANSIAYHLNIRTI